MDQQDAFYTNCLPDLDHEWQNNGVIDMDCDESGIAIVILEYECLNCGAKFTESANAEGEDRPRYDRGSDLA